jgi:hypothetical protein
VVLGRVLSERVGGLGKGMSCDIVYFSVIVTGVQDGMKAKNLPSPMRRRIEEVSFFLPEHKSA